MNAPRDFSIHTQWNGLSIWTAEVSRVEEFTRDRKRQKNHSMQGDKNRGFSVLQESR